MPSEHGPVLFRVRSLSKRYGRLHALTDVSFSVRAGEVLGLIGPNGSGKTTLFECLGGVLPCTGGEIWSGDRRLGAAERRSLLFYLPDGIVPWPSQPLGWVLEFADALFGGRGTREALVRDLDLGPSLHLAMAALSKGQRKRALLAIGLLARQPVLLADEPFDGLDLRQTRHVAALLREVAASGRTLVLSIHQINDAARVCDRFVLLSGGRICGEGTAGELSRLANRPAGGADLEEVFLALT